MTEVFDPFALGRDKALDGQIREFVCGCDSMKTIGCAFQRSQGGK